MAGRDLTHRRPEPPPSLLDEIRAFSRRDRVMGAVGVIAAVYVAYLFVAFLFALGGGQA